MKARELTVILAGTLALAACGGVEDGTSSTSTVSSETWTNKQPVVRIASMPPETPDGLAVGGYLTILGDNFIDPSHGESAIRFVGTYFDSDGNATPVDYSGTVDADITSTGKVQSLMWRMWPNIVFDQRQGDRLGRFVGQLTVINQSNDSSQTISEPLPISLNVKPSLIARQMHPRDFGCNALVTDTLENVNMLFSVEAIGLRPASKESPLTFTWAFSADQVEPKFNTSAFDTSAVQKTTGWIKIEQKVTEGRVSTVGSAASQNAIVRVMADALGGLLGDGRLREIMTKAIPTEANNMAVSVNVEVHDDSGKSTNLSMRFMVHHKVDMVFRHEQREAERYPATPVTDCIPGGDIGRDVTFTEGRSESFQKSVTISWNAGAGGGIGYGSLGLNFNVGFGGSTTESVSSDKQQSFTVNAHILPGKYGICYRQAVRLQWIGRLIAYTECGSSYHLGDALLNDFTWSREIATGSTCPPPSQLPAPYQKYPEKY